MAAYLSGLGVRLTPLLVFPTVDQVKDPRYRSRHTESGAEELQFLGAERLIAKNNPRHRCHQQERHDLRSGPYIKQRIEQVFMETKWFSCDRQA